MRVIPRRIKVKTEFFKNVTISDILAGFIGAGVALAIFLSNFEYHVIVGLAWLSFAVAMFFPIADGVRLYYTLGYLFRFFAQKKKYSTDAKTENAKIDAIVPFADIIEDRFIDYKEYFAQVVEITPLEFGLLNEFKQNMLIETFANAIRRLNEAQSAAIVKESKAMILDNYVYEEDKKFDALTELQFEIDKI